LKALHVTYRFGEEIIGGAEKYLWNLSTQLARQGVELTVATTTAREFRSPTRWNVFWKKGYHRGEEHASGLRILRFPFRNHPRWLAALYGIPLQSRFDSEQWDFEPPAITAEGGGLLVRGWHFEERSGGASHRWIGRRAEIAIRDEYVWEVGFSAYSPWKNSGEVVINGKRIGGFNVNRDIQYFAFKPPEPLSDLNVEIRLKKARRPWKDLRRLGMIVTAVSYKAGDRTVEIPLHRHYLSLLHERKEELLGWFEKRAQSRPKRFSRYFDLCRGPFSPELSRYLFLHAREYDIILGHNFPHPYLAEAVKAGKRAGIPTAALPLAHLEDDYYHWEHYYTALESADLTFALSDYSRDIFRERFHANAHTLGAGIDPGEFESSNTNGDRFRKKYELQETPIILFVGRKSWPKRYPALIRSVRAASRIHPCRLVMIGPDEDGQSIPPEDALYLGKQDRGTILDAYAACDVFANLSDSESFGMVFTEAWMFEKPVIGYRNCGAVASLIEEGKDGFLCGSDEETAGRIVEILQNPSLGAGLGRAGREKTLNRFTWEKVASRAKELYGEIAGGK